MVSLNKKSRVFLRKQSFFVKNGVRQGVILSPLLFNLCMREFKALIRNIPIACCSGNTTTACIFP